jgi:hypothetical protein
MNAPEMLAHVLVAALAGAASAACGGPSPADDADAGPRVDAGPDDWPVDQVGFVHLIEGIVELGNVYAVINDRHDVPLPVVTAADGDCSVWKRPAPSLCSPACTNGVCTAPNVCTPWPKSAPAGRITVTGLTASLAFVPGQFGYTTEPESPPTELFSDTARIKLTAAGGATPAFAIEVDGVPSLSAPVQTLELEDGVDAQVTWAPQQSGKIQLALLFGWHGAPWESMLLCETADDGALTIPGDLISKLPHLPKIGLEQHLSTLMRYRRAVVAAPSGPIEVLIGSSVAIYMTHP